MAKAKRSKSSQKSKEELRREQREALEQKKRRQHALMVIGLVALTILVLAILSLTVFFKVSTVEVDASKSQYSAAQIRDASGISEGESLLLMKRETVRGRISEQLPFTGEITVKRSLPSKVKITVNDSELSAAVRYNDQYYVLNEENKVLAKVGSIESLNSLVERQAKKAKANAKATKPTTKTTTAKDGETTTATTTTTTTTTAAVEETSTTLENAIAGGEDIDKASDTLTIITGVNVKEGRVGHILKAKNADVFQTYNDIMAAMREHGIKDITSIDLSKVTDIRLKYQQRIQILLGSATNLDRKAALCAKVLEEQNKVSTEQKGSIDLSIDGKAYFSEGGATTRTTTVPTVTAEPASDVDPNQSTTAVSTAEGESTTGPSGVTSSTDPSVSDTTTTTQDPADIGG